MAWYLWISQLFHILCVSLATFLMPIMEGRAEEQMITPRQPFPSKSKEESTSTILMAHTLPAEK